MGTRLSIPGPYWDVPGPYWERINQAVETVSEGEGNEAGREGCQGVGAFNSTAEAGELILKDPVEGRGRHNTGTFRRERCRVHRDLKVSQRDFKG